MSSNDVGGFGLANFDFNPKYGDTEGEPDLKGLSSAAEFLLAGAMLGGSEGESPDASATPPTPTPDPLTPAPSDTTSSPNKETKSRPSTANGDSVCKHCGKSFNSVWYLKQHAVKHSSERPFKCKFCHKTYRFRSNLYQHKCPDRDLYMGTKASRAANRDKRKLSIASNGSSGTKGKEPIVRMSSINERAIVTMPPEIAAVTAASVRLASRPPPPEPPATAPVPPPQPPQPPPPEEVEETPASQLGLSEAEVEAYIARFRPRLHRCVKCRLFFPTREHLARHLASHSERDARPVRCPRCSETFALDRELAAHATRAHSSDAALECTSCGGFFATAIALKRHSALCLSLAQRPAICPTQPLAFIDQSPPPAGSMSPGSVGEEVTDGNAAAAVSAVIHSASIEPASTIASSSPSDSPELGSSLSLGAVDSGYSSAESPGKGRAPLSYAPALDAEPEEELLWLPVPASAGLLTLPAMPVVSRRPMKGGLRRVLGSRNAGEEATLDIPPLKAPKAAISTPSNSSPPLRPSSHSPPYKCLRCFKHFRTQRELRKHQESHVPLH